MSAPTTFAEYTKRTTANTVIGGFGADVHTIFPCPFCAAPNWVTCPLMETESIMAQEHTCNECGRSAKAVFGRIPGSLSFEMVQTGGPDQPEYFDVKMRRIDGG